METLFGKSLQELMVIVKEAGLPVFTAKQIADWLYKHHVSEIDQMTNISKKGRDYLNDRFIIGLTNPVNVQSSVDGTKKYLFKSGDHRFIEAAYIPDDDRATLCVSSQIGCKMGCLFCMTGKQGFQGQLTVNEILNQIRSIPEFLQLSNVVYMGMGEPFDNLDNVIKSTEILSSDWGYGWSPKRITVSTIGIIPAMREFLNKSSCHLAVSMHSPFEEERRKLMPIENVYHLSDILALLKEYDWTGQRRVSFEYILFKDVNDSPRHINELAKILNGFKCRVNLIRFHAIPNSPLEPSDENTVQFFKTRLNNKGILTTIRASRGQDIYAACGLLSTKELVKRRNDD
jgi:23S rRNA (adenine2503-C2)-methyltransferase